MFLGSSPLQNASQAQQGPESMWSSLTPQQKMALALMQSSQTSQVNQQGQASPLQGASQLANALLAAHMMGQRNPAQQQTAVTQAAAPAYAGPDTLNPQA